MIISETKQDMKDKITNKGAINVAVSSVVALLLSLAALGVAATHTTPAVSEPQHKVGSLAGPDIPSSYLRWGGVQVVHGSLAPVATSSVFCSIQSPAGTSTLTMASWRVDGVGGFGTGQAFDIATSTNGVATSTPALVAAASLGTSQVWVPSASSTGIATQVLSNGGNTNGVVNAFVLPPNTFVNFRVATSTPGTFSSYLSGNCQAEFIVL